VASLTSAPVTCLQSLKLLSLITSFCQLTLNTAVEKYELWKFKSRKTLISQVPTL
jgi:hypothetical protein